MRAELGHKALLQNHEPLPPQVPEPVGPGSKIPLPAGDWVPVPRYDEGKGGGRPSQKVKWDESLTDVGRRKGAYRNGGRRTPQRKGFKGLRSKIPDRSGARDRIPYGAGGRDRALQRRKEKGAS